MDDPRDRRGPLGPRPDQRPLPPGLDPRGAGRARQPGPPAPTPPRRAGATRALRWLAAATSCLVLLVSAGGYLLVTHYAGNISKIDGILSSGGDTPPAAPAHAENVLLVGSDTRGSQKAGQGFQGSGATFVAGQRSDTVILAHLYGSSRKAQLVSFPRDSLVEIPAWTDPRTQRVHPAHRDRINASFAEGGPALLIRTLQKLTGIRIDHYVQVDFQGFQTMVDRLGGVDVCLSQAAHDRYSGIDLSAGRHHINGSVALAFVRQRHGLAAGDLDRIKRQQQFIGSLVRKVLSSGTLLNPLKLNGFLDAATSSLQVDSALTVRDLRDLALRLRNFNAGGVLFSTVNVAKINGYVPGLGDVVLLDDAKNAALFGALRRDLPPVAPAALAGQNRRLVVPPAAVRVQVFNGSGVAGLGRRAAADLADDHFQVIGVPTNRGTGATATTVFYGPDRADSARTLTAALPGATVAADPTLVDTLDVVVGSSYRGAVPVTVNARGRTASPAPHLVTAAEDPCASG